MPEKTSENANPTARSSYQKGLAAMERNNWDYAVELFLQALSSEPNFLKCRQYLRASQTKKAESAGAFKRALIGAKTQHLQAKARMALKKNPLEAMAIAEQILSEDPKSSQAIWLLAEASELANLPETTIQTLEYLTKISPRDTKAQHWLARAYSAAGRYDMSRNIYDGLLLINPADFEAQKGSKDATAHGAMKDGKWEEDGTFHDKLKDKDESVALEQQSRVVRADDMIANLIKAQLDKLKMEPENPVIQRELGKLYTQRGDYDKALQCLEILFAKEGGNDPTLEHDISEIRGKRIEAHISAKKKALLAKPNDEALKAEIAALELDFDRVQLAEQEKLVERYPNDLLYRYELGSLYMRTGNISAAIQQFQKSNGHPQRRVASLRFLGECFMHEGMADLAVDQFLTAIKEQQVMDGLKKDLLYDLGRAYEILGQPEKAIAEYKKIAAVDFGYKDVKARITRKPAAQADSSGTPSI